MSKMQLKTVAAIAAAMVAGHVFADYTTGTVSGLAAKQRRPWNGKVDISFTLSGPESGYCIAVAATNSATGAEVPVRTLRDRGGNAIDAWTKFAPGSISLVWDAGSDVPDTLIEALALSVVIAHPHPRVQLWEGGPYWATTNVGAEEPEEYGLYFWWGDTVGYRREGRAWVASDGSSQNFSFSSGNTPTYGKIPSTLLSQGWVVSKNGTYILAPKHDAAQAHLGGAWRMPTKGELSALNSNCDWTWTTRNGVNGYEVRGRGDYSEASIFLPAAGGGDGTSLDFAGSYGYYWSSVPGSDYDNSWFLYFYSIDHDTGNYYYSRYNGQPVRPVQGVAE